MDLTQFAEQNFTLALLIFTRVSGIFIAAPIFSSRNIPVRMRVLLTLAITLVLLPVFLQKQLIALPNALLPYIICLFTEFLIGVCIGLIMAFFFAIIQTAGQILDTQIGFGIVNVIDPQSGMQMPLLGNFIQMIFTLVFFISDMHHLFLSALFDSFTLLPVLSTVMVPSVSLFFTDLFVGMFLTAFSLAMPMIIATLLVEVSMGMLARTMPQMNVFVVGIPLKLAVGIFMLSIFLPTYIYVLKAAYHEVSANIYRLLAIFAG